MTSSRTRRSLGAFERARERGANVHLLGLVSYGGVHSHIDHLRALLELARREGMSERTYVHAFTDGRDVSPTSARSDLAELVAEGARIATVSGRYYAMDRDGRWERTDRALAAIMDGEGEHADDPVAAVEASYARGVTDEFIEPVVLPLPRLDAGGWGDPLQLPRGSGAPARTASSGEGRRLDDDDRATGPTSTCPVAFEEAVVVDTMAEVLAEHGLRQLHVAETEKYAHVTYFFNGGREQEWAGETRILVPSPREVATYDLKPEMSAAEVADRFAAELPNGYAFAVVNYANPDMVGHTGVIPAVVRAVQATDAALGATVAAVEELGGVCLVTADHGNAEQQLEADGVSPHTAHTTNPVPLIVTLPGTELEEGGALADLVPTCLWLLGLPRAEGMSGSSLIRPV